MKYLISVEEFIIEGVNSYNFNLIDNNPQLIKYSFFDIVGNEYLVEFKWTSKRTYELFYYVKHEGQFSVSKIVNVNPFRTLKTVFNDIINDFSKRFQDVKTVFFTGLGKDVEKEYITSRTRVYKRYLDMNPPEDFEITQIGNTITLNRK